MRANGELNEDEFAKKKIEFTGRKCSLEQQISNCKSGQIDWIDKVKIAFDFLNEVKERFIKGSLEEKRQLCRL